MSQLKEYKDLADIFFIVDLLASEYGWTITEIQDLTTPEISGLIYAMARRKLGKDADDKLPLPKSSTPINEMDKLVSLAKKLKATPTQINDIKSGKEVKL
jgi:hypothetical protein